MAELLHALHEHRPLPEWAPPPAAPAPNAHVHPLFRSILNAHVFALPDGPYPTARWPEGLEHIAQPGGAL